MKLIRSNKQRSHMFRFAGLSYGTRSGGPVLVDNATWRNINGFYVNSRLIGCWWLLFRRHQ
jgi:hypothetical protein